LKIYIHVFIEKCNAIKEAYASSNLPEKNYEEKMKVIIIHPASREFISWFL